MKKKRVILFQPYLRRFVLNFGRHLKHFDYIHVARPPKTGVNANSLPSYEKEINRQKINGRTHLRRFLGVPNVRIRFDRDADIFFTYACLVITSKPYCTYIETGLAIYNYDLGIAKNPIARWLVIVLATRKNCKQLIFLSEAAKKSFFATVRYPKWARRILESKSCVIYPIPIEKQHVPPKRFTGTLRLLFPGTFYMKGGMEIAHAYERLRQTYSNVSLTIVTPLQTVAPNDLVYLASLPDLTLLDATLSEREMISLYRSHDIFLLPTFRDGFGLVLIEALAYGMPMIITDQFATSEMLQDGKNGFVFKGHPLRDYSPKSYELLGRYHNPKDFYSDLFQFQREGKLKPVEDFLVSSITRFLENTKLVEEFSKASLKLYSQKFDAEKLGKQFESVLQTAVNTKQR